MDALLNISSAFGLSASAGLNAYLTLLSVALTARFTNLITLNEPWNVLTNSWVIGVLVVLLLIETAVDKIPGVDTVNDVVQTVGRPAAGAIIFAANSGVVGDLHPVLACITGLLLAGGVHAAKTTARPLVTASTGGTANWVVSLVEDILAVIAIVLSIVLPVLMVIMVITFFSLFAWWQIQRRQQNAVA